jgi:hypothetical protein
MVSDFECRGFWLKSFHLTDEVREVYGGVYVFPTFFFLSDGKVLFEVSGFKSAEVLEGYLKETSERASPPEKEEKNTKPRRARAEIED